MHGEELPVTKAKFSTKGDGTRQPTAKQVRGAIQSILEGLPCRSAVTGVAIYVASGLD